MNALAVSEGAALKLECVSGWKIGSTSRLVVGLVVPMPRVPKRKGLFSGFLSGPDHTLLHFSLTKLDCPSVPGTGRWVMAEEKGGKEHTTGQEEGRTAPQCLKGKGAQDLGLSPRPIRFLSHCRADPVTSSRGRCGGGRHPHVSGQPL